MVEDTVGSGFQLALQSGEAGCPHLLQIPVVLALRLAQIVAAKALIRPKAMRFHRKSTKKRNPRAKMGLWMIWLLWLSIRDFSRTSRLPRRTTAAGDFGQMDDATIMLELRTGNMAGFDYLIQKYRKPIIHFMYRMVRNQAVAEELAQEVFLRVYRSRETYRAEARFSTWLYRIATNLGSYCPRYPS